MTTLDGKLRIKHLGVRELKPNGKGKQILETDIIPSADLLVRTNENGSGKPGLVQYAVLRGSVDAEKLPSAAFLVEGEPIRVVYPFSYELRGGDFIRVYRQPEFR
ncbi:hypothetical protein HYV80_01690 [Candidatus Woesearchaeota archaeon]|nr:hypothetical protein [Candidatus Woesearchaeota archaeon]